MITLQASALRWSVLGLVLLPFIGCTPPAPDSGTAPDSTTTPAAGDDANVDAQPNQAPSASAGSDLTASEGQMVELNGSSSFDPDGDTLDFAWSQIDGEVQADLQDANRSIAYFTAPLVNEDATLEFNLSVSDGHSSVEDHVIVVVSDVETDPAPDDEEGAEEEDGETDEEPVLDCMSDTDCGDGVFCNGTEFCSAGVCLAGAVPCLDRPCDENVDHCLDPACIEHADCDDAAFCNGVEMCVAGECVSSGNPCTEGETCDEEFDSCEEIPAACTSDPDCDDGLFCNGAEICFEGTCGPAIGPCPEQACDEDIDRCLDCLNDADCVDDLFCNGQETCSDGTCIRGSDPCAHDEHCNEVQDICEVPGEDQLLAEAQRVLVHRNTPKSIVVTGRDSQGHSSMGPLADVLSFTIVTHPTHGTLFGSPPHMRYQPELEFQGLDSFAFTVNDGISDSLPGIVDITVAAFEPPIGIPNVEFGISEIAGPYTYYIDNSHSQATDADNPRGTESRPRMTLPGGDTLYLEPGDVVEIHGGVEVPYTYHKNQKWVQGFASADQPIFIHGVADAQQRLPQFDKTLRPRGSHIIVEGLDLAALRIISGSDHVTLRHSEVWGYSVQLVSAYDGADLEHVVVYNNLIHDLGNWLAQYDQDVHGVGINVDSDINCDLRHVWILDNEFYHCSGNAVQVRAGYNGNTLQPNLNHVYIGRNVAHHNKQRAIGIKQSEHVVVSQNRIYGHGPVGENPSNPGDGLGANYGPEYVWFLFNEIYDCANGIRYSSGNIGTGQHLFIIGNMIYDIRHHAMDVTGQYPVNYDPENAWSPGKAITLWNPSNTKYVINNTISGVDGGITVVPVSDNSVIIANNIVDNVDDGSGLTQHVRIAQPGTADVSLAYHNLFDPGARIRWGTSTIYDVDGFEAAYPDNGWNNLQADPAFSDPQRHDFHLRADSPAINAGISYDAYHIFFDLYGIRIEVDFDRRQRPIGGAWDLGCFER